MKMEKVGDVELKEWKCVQVTHHNNVSKEIEEYQEMGWHLHTYCAAGQGMDETIHYLLFEKMSKTKQSCLLTFPYF